MAIGPVDSPLLSRLQPKTAPARPPDKPNAPAGDRVEIRGAPPEPATYSALRTSGASARKTDLDAALEEAKKQVEQFMRMLGQAVEEQGLEWNKVVSGEQKLTVDPATREAAQKAIGPDGEFGVAKTAGRILDFAKAVIGGDPKKLATIRAAVEKGFGEAEQAFGGKLPDISYETMNAVRAEFDRWEAEGLS